MGKAQSDHKRRKHDKNYEDSKRENMIIKIIIGCRNL